MALYMTYRIGSIAVRPHMRGALALVQVGEHILLVRNSYNSWFTLPGGRVDRGEGFMAGAARELREETGVQLPEEALQRVFASTHSWQHRTEQIEIHAAHLDQRPALTLDPVEIAEARWVTASEALQLRLYPPLRNHLLAVRNASGTKNR
ncbi:MAG: NUDIX hydrolase [Minwuia sp.]|nr:NUDIX hydrolase [Minwuia sp.]